MSDQPSSPGSSPPPPEPAVETKPRDAAPSTQSAPGPGVEPSTVPLPASPPKPAELPAVPGYEILRFLDDGGMGVVYLARQQNLDRLVALKMIRDKLVRLEDLARFHTEARAVADLEH